MNDVEMSPRYPTGEPRVMRKMSAPKYVKICAWAPRGAAALSGSFVIFIGASQRRRPRGHAIRAPRRSLPRDPHLFVSLDRLSRKGCPRAPARRHKMLLKNKIAVIYGAGGAIGGAIARAFGSDGAKLFLTGRLRAPVAAVAKDVVSAGGAAEAAEVDALDEPAVGKHLQSVIDKAGRVDISFNAIGVPDAKILGVPLVEMDIEQFSLPISMYIRSYFLTARMAARRMVPNKSGVIMTVTALPSRTGTRL